MKPPVLIHSKKVRKLLENLGFEQHARVFKWKGAAHRVWLRNRVTDQVTDLNPDQIRGLLDKTVPDPSLDFLG
jgi:hypothetical protein